MVSQNLLPWRSLERVPLLDATRIARLDYESFVLHSDKVKSVTADEFSNSNSYGYYILINTWLGVALDLGGAGTASSLLAVIRRQGVLAASTVLKALGDNLVQAAARAAVFTSSVTTVVRPDLSNLEMETQETRELVTRVSKLPFKFARQICVYSKRFAPIVPQRCSVLHEKGIAAFVATNKANIATEYRINSLAPLVDRQEGDDRRLPFRLTTVTARFVKIAQLARLICHWILGEYKGLSHVHAGELPRFGPGACRNAGNGTLDRYERCVQYGYYQPSVLPDQRMVAGIGIPYRPHPDVLPSGIGTGIGPDMWSRGFWGTSKYPQVCRPSSVPKTQWANRLIAVEDVCNQSDQLHLKDDMQARFDATVGDAIPVRNQDVNREAARVAALTDKWATLDLSHASDSVVKALVRMLVPHSWWDHGFQRCIPYGYIVPSIAKILVRALHMFATMGCGCTFNTEALMFYSLTLATCLYEEYGGWLLGVGLSDNELKFLAQSMAIHVMGDDIICRTCYAESVISTLVYFGFEVNVDKSFLQGRFRESCGADWLRCDHEAGPAVEDVSCVYYPRIPIGRDFVGSMLHVHRSWSESDQEAFYESGLSRIVALQQRLFDLSPTASQFLLRLVQEHFPDLSTSFPGQYPNTLWTYEPVGTYIYNVSDLLDEFVCLGKSVSRLRKDGWDGYADFHDCWQILIRRFERSFGRKPSAAELPLLRIQLTWRQRRLLTVPRLVVTSYTHATAWGANALLYELSLTRVETDDEVVPITVVDRGRTIQLHRLSPARSVRPSRLSRSRLLAEDYETKLITEMQ